MRQTINRGRSWNSARMWVRAAVRLPKVLAVCPSSDPSTTLTCILLRQEPSQHSLDACEAGLQHCWQGIGSKQPRPCNLVQVRPAHTGTVHRAAAQAWQQCSRATHLGIDGPARSSKYVRTGAQAISGAEMSLSLLRQLQACALSKRHAANVYRCGTSQRPSHSTTPYYCNLLISPQQAQ